MLEAYQEDVGAELEDAVDAGQLLEHQGVADAAEELTHKLPDHQHNRRIESHDAAHTHTHTHITTDTHISTDTVP